MESGPKIVFIAGPTASGKTGLAVEVAQKIGAEIICADSQTIRKWMDIGTAKPTTEEMQGIPHHMLDIIEPYDPYSVAEYARQARMLIEDIVSKGKRVVIAGGTGLYIDALYFQFDFDSIPRESSREELDLLSVEELQNLIRERGYTMPENSQNKRYLMRALERGGVSGTRSEPLPSSVIVGLHPDRGLLVERIDRRVETMFGGGFVAEVKDIVARFGRPPLSFDAIGYRIAVRLLDGEISEMRAKELFKIADRQYAKRQLTWLKRNQDVVWFKIPKDAKSYILSL